MITKEMETQVKILNSRFRYEEDKTNHGVVDYWTAMPLEKVMKGDCEDYSLTLLSMLCGGSKLKMFWCLLTKKASLYFVEIPGIGGHCVMKYNGEYIDNNFRYWTFRTTMCTKGKYVFKSRYSVAMIGLKILGGKLLKLANRAGLL